MMYAFSILPTKALIGWLFCRLGKPQTKTTKPTVSELLKEVKIRMETWEF